MIIDGADSAVLADFWRFFFFKFYFIFKLYITVLVLPNIKMNPPQVYMCSPSWTLLPPPSPYHPSGSSQCTSPKHTVSCIELDCKKFVLNFKFIFGCAGFAVLWGLFSSFGEQGLHSSCGAWASYCSFCWAQALGNLGFSSYTCAIEQGLNCCGARA